MSNGIWTLGKIQNKKQKTVTHFTPQLKMIFIRISPVKNPKSRLCTRLFKVKIINKWLISFLANFVMPLNDSVDRKIGHIEMDPVI